MGRPKSSTAGLADLFLTVYNSRKLSKYKKQIKLQDETLELQAARLDSKMDLIYQSVNMGNQIAMQSTMLMAQGTITGLLTLTAEVEKLSEQTWNVLSVMNEIDQKEEILGTLRLFLIEIEEEIERLNILKIDFPEFTAAILDEINLLFIENNVSIDKFKRMNSVEDIKWAKQVIREFEQLHHESMHARAVDEAHSARHELLIETIQIIIELEQNVIQTTAEWTFDEYLARDTQLQGLKNKKTKLLQSQLEIQERWTFDEYLTRDTQLQGLKTKKTKLLQSPLEIQEIIHILELEYENKMANAKIPAHLAEKFGKDPESREQLLRAERAKLKRELQNIVKDMEQKGPEKTKIDLLQSIEYNILQKIEHLQNEFEVISQAVKKEEELEAQSKEIEAIKSDIASQWIKISDLIPDQRIDSATLSNLSESVKRNL